MKLDEGNILRKIKNIIDPFFICKNKKYSAYDIGKLTYGQPETKGNIVIGNDVWIGTEAIIMSGVEVGMARL